ncbi:MAG TPA: uracil-DNA glycosylase [Candidatus Aquilonibacter sp.]|jgi:uracil-DNA glycosylase family 4|nr:uracil-DNA glycosylase [Candidatus Aquilonibacter sp.]
MPHTLEPELRRALAERVRYCHEMGIYDFYRRGPLSPQGGLEPVAAVISSFPEFQNEAREEMTAKKSTVAQAVAEDNIFEVITPKPEYGVADPAAALKLIREDLGDCIRCKLSKGRTKIVFGVGDPHAELMFVGEGPGADEDAQGEPFVGRAGQLLNNMIKAMGLRREDVYIANVVKCRPPGNRQPERDECDTCSPFLMRQIAAIKPKVIVALGATAAKNLLAMNSSMADLRGRFYDFMPAGVRNDPSWPGARLAVTYHPAFLLRDPRQKGEAWKDLQMVMKYLGIEPPKKAAE